MPLRKFTDEQRALLLQKAPQINPDEWLYDPDTDEVVPIPKENMEPLDTFLRQTGLGVAPMAVGKVVGGIATRMAGGPTAAAAATAGTGAAPGVGTVAGGLAGMGLVGLAGDIVGTVGAGIVQDKILSSNEWGRAVLERAAIDREVNPKAYIAGNVISGGFLTRPHKFITTALKEGFAKAGGKEGAKEFAATTVAEAVKGGAITAGLQSAIQSVVAGKFVAPELEDVIGGVIGGGLLPSDNRLGQKLRGLAAPSAPPTPPPVPPSGGRKTGVKLDPAVLTDYYTLLEQGNTRGVPAYIRDAHKAGRAAFGEGNPAFTPDVLGTLLSKYENNYEAGARALSKDPAAAAAGAASAKAAAAADIPGITPVQAAAFMDVEADVKLPEQMRKDLKLIRTAVPGVTPEQVATVLNSPDRRAALIELKRMTLTTEAARVEAETAALRREAAAQAEAKRAEEQAALDTGYASALASAKRIFAEPTRTDLLNALPAKARKLVTAEQPLITTPVELADFLTGRATVEQLMAQRAQATAAPPLPTQKRLDEIKLEADTAVAAANTQLTRRTLASALLKDPTNPDLLNILPPKVRKAVNVIARTPEEIEGLWAGTLKPEELGAKYGIDLAKVGLAQQAQNATETVGMSNALWNAYQVDKASTLSLLQKLGYNDDFVVRVVNDNLIKGPRDFDALMNGSRTTKTWADELTRSRYANTAELSLAELERIKVDAQAAKVAEAQLVAQRVAAAQSPRATAVMEETAKLIGAGLDPATAKKAATKVVAQRPEFSTPLETETSPAGTVATVTPKPLAEITIGTDKWQIMRSGEGEFAYVDPLTRLTSKGYTTVEEAAEAARAISRERARVMGGNKFKAGDKAVFAAGNGEKVDVLSVSGNTARIQYMVKGIDPGGKVTDKLVATDVSVSQLEPAPAEVKKAADAPTRVETVKPYEGVLEPEMTVVFRNAAGEQVTGKIVKIMPNGVPFVRVGDRVILKGRADIISATKAVVTPPQAGEQVLTKTGDVATVTKVHDGGLTEVRGQDGTPEVKDTATLVDTTAPEIPAVLDRPTTAFLARKVLSGVTTADLSKQTKVASSLITSLRKALAKELDPANPVMAAWLNANPGKTAADYAASLIDSGYFDDTLKIGKRITGARPIPVVPQGGMKTKGKGKGEAGFIDIGAAYDEVESLLRTLRGKLAGVELKDAIDPIYWMYRLTKPVVSRIKDYGREGQYVSDRLQLALRDRVAISNRYMGPFMDIYRSLSKQERANVSAAMDAVFDARSRDAMPTLTNRERDAADRLYALFGAMGDELESGPLVRAFRGGAAELRPRVLLEYWRPQKIRQDAMERMGNTMGSAERERLIEWLVTRDGAPRPEAERIVSNMLGTNGGEPNADFKPVRYAEGAGLPPELRDNVWDSTINYIKRMSSDLAWHRNVEADPIANRALNLGDDGRGNVYGEEVTWDDGTPVLPELREKPPMKHFAQWYAGRNLAASRRTMGLYQLITALKIGPISAASDVITSPAIMLSHLEPGEFRNVFKGLLNINMRDAYAGGAFTRRTIPQENFSEELTSGMQRLATQMSRWSGAEWLSNFGRAWAYETGRITAESRYGDPRLMSKFGPANWRDMPRAEVIRHMAQEMALATHGSYGADELPNSLLDGVGAARYLLGWGRWSVGRFNRFYDKVWAPAKNGDFRGLAGAMLGAVGGSVLREWVNENIRKSKPPELTWSEWIHVGMPADKTFIASRLAQSSVSGILGDLLLIGAQLKDNQAGEVQGYSFPPAEVVGTLVQRLGQFFEALDAGRPLGELVMDFGKQTLSENIQLVGTARKYMRPDKGYREKAMFKRDVYGVKYVPSNPFMPGAALRRAETPEDVLEAAQGLDPARRVNVPDSVQDPAFYDYLGMLQGPAKANERLSADLAEQPLTELKKAVAPSGDSTLRYMQWKQQGF